MGYKINSLSLFFPAYNEEANAKTTILKAKKVLENIAKDWEIIVINDGSTDRTKEIFKHSVIDVPAQVSYK